MPPYLALYDDDDEPADDFAVAISGGEESAIIVRRIWNDKDLAEGDATTAVAAILGLLMSQAGGALKSSGLTPLDERWFRARVTGALGTAEARSSDTQSLGTNSELVLGDIPPGGGVRIELQVIAPGGHGASAVTVKFNVDGLRASAPLSKFTALGTGSGVIPADRVDGLLSIIEGGTVTADNTDTVAVARGKIVAAGTIVQFPASEWVATLADGEAVDLDADESYLVTLSRTPAGVLVATKGPKTEAVNHPAVPAGNALQATLAVESADGIAVTVAPSSVTQAPNKYAQFSVRAGTGLTVIISRGDGVTSSDFRQYLTNDIIANIVASSTNRIWRLGDGAQAITQTDVPPEFNADLEWLAITDTDNVTDVIDMRRFVHRSLTTWPIELVWRGVLTDLAEPSHGLALAIAHFDGEIDEVAGDVTGLDAGLTGGALKFDVMIVTPGATAPFPAGGAGGTSIFTSSATDDVRPAIAFDATNLRATTSDHEVRRFVKGSRFLLSAITTVTGPGAEPEQEIRVTLHARRYR